MVMRSSLNHRPHDPIAIAPKSSRIRAHYNQDFPDRAVRDEGKPMAGLNDNWTQQALTLLEQQRDRFVMLINNSLMLGWVGDGARDVLGWEPGQQLGRSAFEFVHPNDLHVLLGALDHRRTNGPLPTAATFMSCELRLQAANGQWVWCQLAPMDHPADFDITVTGFVVHRRSVRNPIETLADQLAGGQSLDDTLISLCKYVDQSFHRGHTSVLLGTRWVRLHPRLAREPSPGSIYRHVGDDGTKMISVEDADSGVVSFVRSIQGAGVWLTPIEISSGSRPIGALVTVIDFVDEPTDSARLALRTAARLAGMAVQLLSTPAEVDELISSDPLTGMASRRRLDDWLEDLVDKDHMAVLTIRASRIPSAGTTSHHFVDLVLIELSRRLYAGLRPGDLVARVGDHQFTVLLPSVVSRVEAERVAERLVTAAQRSFSVMGRLVEIGLSIGIEVRAGTEPLTTMITRASERLITDPFVLIAAGHASTNGRA